MHNAFLEQIRRFYELHRQELFTYALALTRRRELAEDVVHTAFHKILRRGSAPRELRPYVFRCIRNAAIDELRRAERPAPEESLFAKSNGNGDGALQAALDASLATLNADERESIVLKLYDGLTFTEIASVRRVSINTASSWYRRGIEKLRARMRERMNDEEY